MENGKPIWYATMLDNAGLRQGEADARRIWQNMQRDAANAGSGVEKVWQKTGAAVGTYLSARALADFARQVVTVRGEMQGLGLAFETMLGSKAKADKMMADVIDFAQKTPFTVTDVASNVKQLIAMGAAGDDVMKTFKTLGDVAAGVNVPISRIAINFGQVAALGKLQGREIRDFAMAGIPIVGELAQMYGVAQDEIMGMVEAGKIGFPDVQKAFEAMAGAGGRFNNMMEKLNSTVSGQMSRLQDQIEQMFNKIGEANEGVIYGAISGAASLVENYEKVGKILVSLIATYGAYRAALMFATAATKGWTAAELIHYKVLVIVDRAQKILNRTMLSNPLVLITTLAIGLVAAMWALRDSTTAAERAQERLNKRQEEFAQKEQERRSRIDELIRIIQDETQTLYAQITAYEELQKLSPALTDAYTREELAVAELAATNKQLNSEQDKRNYDKLISDIDNARKSIVRLKEMFDLMASTPDSGFGLIRIGKQIEEQEAGLAILEQNLYDYNKRMAEAEFNALPPAEKIKIKEEQLAKIRSEFDKVNSVINEEMAKLPKEVNIPFRVEVTDGKQVQGWQPYGTQGSNWGPQRLGVQQARADALRAEEQALQAEIAAIEDGNKKKTELSKEERKRIADEARRKRETAEKASEQYQELLVQLRNDERQAEIDAMDDGLDKEIEQIKLDYDRRIQEINTQEARLKKTKEEAGQGDLTTNETDMFQNMRRDAETERKRDEDADAKAEADAQQADLDGFRSFEQEYLRLYEEFQTKRAAAEKGGADPLGLAKADAEFETQMQQLATKFAESDTQFKEWADGINKMVDGATESGADAIIQAAIGNLTKQLAAAEVQLATIRENGIEEGEGESLRQAMAQIEVLKKALADVQNQGKKTENTFARWRDVNKVIGQSSDIFKKLGGEIGGTAGEIITAIGEITDAVLGAANSITTLFEGGLKPVVDMADSISDVTDKVSDVSDTATEAMESVSGAATGTAGAIGTAAASLSAMEKASVILTVISVAVQAITAIISGANKAAKKYFDNTLDNIQKAYDEIEQRRDDPLFFRLLEDGNLEEINKIIDAFEEVANAYYAIDFSIRSANSSSDKFLHNYARIPAQQKMMDSFAKSVEELSSAFVDLGYNAGKSFGDQKYDTVKQDLSDISQQILIMEQEAIAASNAAAASKTKGKDKREYEKRAEEARKNRDKLISEGAQVLTNAINDILGTTTEDISQTLGNALFDAFDNGIDAAEAWGKAVKDVIRDIARNTIIEQAITKRVSGIIDDITGDWYDDKGNFIGLEHVRKDLKQLAESLNALGPEFEETAKIINEQFGTASEDAERTSASQGFAQASQDSIDNLFGVFVNIENSTFDMKNGVVEIRDMMRSNQKIQQENTDVMLGHLSAIHFNTDRLEAIESHLLASNRSLNNISDGISQLNRV